MFGKGSPVAVPKYAAGRLDGSLGLGVQQIQVKNIRFTSWLQRLTVPGIGPICSGCFEERKEQDVSSNLGNI